MQTAGACKATGEDSHHYEMQCTPPGEAHPQDSEVQCPPGRQVLQPSTTQFLTATLLHLSGAVSSAGWPVSMLLVIN